MILEHCVVVIMIEAKGEGNFLVISTIARNIYD